MNVIEIALRNFLANQGLPAEGLDAIIGTPQLEQMQDLAAAMLFGPFGNLVPFEVAATDEEVNDALEGYVQALEETIEHIDGAVIHVPCEHSAQAVHSVLEQLKTDIRARIHEVDCDDTEVEASDEQLDLFRVPPVSPNFDEGFENGMRALFELLGLNVHFVQTAG